MADDDRPRSELELRVRDQGLPKTIAAYTGNFARIVPEHVNVDTFVGLAAAQVARDEWLTRAAQVNPESLISTLRECAVRGHVPQRGVFALVPFRNKKAKGGWEVVGVEEVRGVIERMFRAGGVLAVHAEIVRDGDIFQAPMRPGLLPRRHDVDPDASPQERGPLRGVYAYADMHTGNPSHVVWLNRHDILKYRAASRSGENFWGPPWPDEGPWTPDMWRKTALHRLEKWVPTSAAYRWSVSRAEAAAEQPIAGVPERPSNLELNDPPPVVVDATIVDDEGAGAGAWPAVTEPGGAS